MLKQVIVIRTDLNMRKGKMIAQGAHASLEVFLSRVLTDAQFQLDFEDFLKSKGYETDEPMIAMRLTPAMFQWMNESFTKICVRVSSEDELLQIAQQAEDANLPCQVITDAGRTEFHGVPTNTCLAIGPAEADEIDAITGHLSLL